MADIIFLYSCAFDDQNPYAHIRISDGNENSILFLMLTCLHYESPQILFHRGKQKFLKKKVTRTIQYRNEIMVDGLDRRS